MLHVHTGAGTFENEISHIRISLTPVPLCVLISVNVRESKVCQRASVRRSGSIQRFPYEADAKDRSFGFVQKLHLLFGIFREFAGNAADHIAANTGQLFPGDTAVGKFSAVVGSAGILAISDTKKIQRHGVNQCAVAASGPVKLQLTLVEWIPKIEADQFRDFTGLSTVSLFCSTDQPSGQRCEAHSAAFAIAPIPA